MILGSQSINDLNVNDLLLEETLDLLKFLITINPTWHELVSWQISLSSLLPPCYLYLASIKS